VVIDTPSSEASDFRPVCLRGATLFLPDAERSFAVSKTFWKNVTEQRASQSSTWRPKAPGSNAPKDAERPLFAMLVVGHKRKRRAKARRNAIDHVGR
jgi:hypothetical protein